jgi:hypothetical protein
MRDHFVEASRENKRLRAQTREALRRAYRAEMNYLELLLQSVSLGTFASQPGARLIPPSVQQDLMVLGLQWPCTREEVQKGYREAAKKHHPDRGGEEQQFKQVQAAYDRIQKYCDQAGIQ